MYPFRRWLLSCAMTNVTKTKLAAGLLLGVGLLWAFDATAKPKKKAPPPAYSSAGSLFVAQTPFPTDAADDAELIKNGRKHHRSRLKWSSGDELRFQFLLVLKRPFGATSLYLVLFQKGEKGYKDAQTINVKTNMQRLVSWVVFTGDYLKSGTQYELRAIRVRGKGKQRHETILARAHFRI